MKLKPLEWSPIGEDFDTSYADTIFGMYSVWVVGGTAYVRVPNSYGGTVVGTSYEDGKKAAEEDIKNRILELVEPTFPMTDEAIKSSLRVPDVNNLMRNIVRGVERYHGI